MPNQTPGRKLSNQGRPKQVLIVLKKEGRRRTTELVKMTGIQRSNLCNYLRVLENDGYVKTTKDNRPGHRMKRYKEITPAGLMFLEGLYKDTPEPDDFYVHEEIKKEDGDISFNEYKKMKQGESELDGLLNEDF